MSVARRLIVTTTIVLAAGVPLTLPGSSGAVESVSREHTGRVWASISAGGEHTCGIRLNGTLWCWGANGNGQLGLGDMKNRLAPIIVDDGLWLQVSASDFGHTCGIRQDHSLWCWGYNISGQLGTGDDDYRFVPTRVEGHASWAAVSTGYGHTCGVRLDHSLWCWGDNSSGQLGIGSDEYSVFDPTQVLPGSHWVMVSAGRSHTCGVRHGATVWCWGQGGRGALGQGDRLNRNAPARVGARTDWTQVTASLMFTCGIRATHTLWCWGFNVRGQLGVGDRTDRYTPVKVAGDFWEDVTVSSGGLHACAITVDGALFCWGAGNRGQLGYGGTSDQVSPLRVGTRNDWQPPSAGGAHTCAIRTNHGLLCWGWNRRGQLGIGNKESKLVPRVV